MASEIRRCNETAARSLNMTVRTYKTIKAVTQLLAVAAGFYAMSLGAPAFATFALVALIVSGPEAFEAILSNTE